MKISPKTWSSEAITNLLDAITKTGKMPKYSPFYDGDSNKRNADLNYEYTEEESIELAKIFMSAFYFAEEFCYIKSGSEKKKIKLRKYQKQILHDLVNRKKLVWTASRQIGKCSSGSTRIQINKLGDTSIKPLYKLYFESKINLTIIERIKWKLYDIKYWLETKIG